MQDAPVEALPVLTEAEARVLGCLVEKDITTPDYYPLTLNALTNACNQINNRDPVVAYGEQEVVRAIDGLREKKLAYRFEGADSRVSKFGHRLPETFEFGRPETSLLCVLLLRGPQTVGELRGRTARMHAFQSLEETEAVLDRLATRTPAPLVTKLARQSGMKEQRFAHLLCGPVSSPLAVPETTRSQRGDPPPAEASTVRLEAEVAALRAEVAALRQELADFRKQLE